MTQEEVMTAMWQSLLDDRKAERRRTYVKYAVLGAIAALYGAAFVAAQVTNSDSSSPSEKYATVVRISGEIGPGKDASAAVLNPLLERAFSDKKSEGVVLLINSPGGTPVQSSLIHDKVESLKAKYKKKVVAVGEDMVTSGAYFIAVSADEIVVNKSTIAGSIGVVSRGFGYTELMGKLGVERRVMTAGESKNLGDSFGPRTEAGDIKQAELLAEIHTHFKDVVKAGRGSRLKLDSPGLFSGTVWTGEQSVAMGLTDKLGSLETASQEAFGTTTLKEIRPPKSLMDVVIGGIGMKMSQVLSPELTSRVLLEPN